MIYDITNTWSCGYEIYNISMIVRLFLCEYDISLSIPTWDFLGFLSKVFSTTAISLLGVAGTPSMDATMSLVREDAILVAAANPWFKVWYPAGSTRYNQKRTNNRLHLATLSNFSLLSIMLPISLLRAHIQSHINFLLCDASFIIHTTVGIYVYSLQRSYLIIKYSNRKHNLI